MINIWGYSEKSTYHGTCVRKVYRYLKNKCDKADYERKIVTDRITDALGCNTTSKTWYLCEIKVNRNDAQKGVTQIHDTAFRFRKIHRGFVVVPVLAIPSRLQKELMKYDNWNILYDQCENSGIAIWIIEQSSVREVKSHKIKKSVKTRSSNVSTTKKKVIRTKNTVAKKPVTKTRIVRKPKTTKKKTTQPKSTRLKKRVIKSSRAKTPKTKSTKRKTSAIKSVKAKPTRKKH